MVQDVDEIGVNYQVFHNVEQEGETVVGNVSSLLCELYEVFFIKTSEVLSDLSTSNWVL
jgi:hypothetical protein